MEGELWEVRQLIVIERTFNVCYVPCAFHIQYPIWLNRHKNPAKSITVLHSLVAEIGGKKSPKNRRDEMTLPCFSQVYCFVVLQTPNNLELLKLSSLFSVINVLCCELFSGSLCWKRPRSRDDGCFDKWVNSQAGQVVRGKYSYRKAQGASLHRWALWLVLLAWITRRMLEKVKKP